MLEKLFFGKWLEKCHFIVRHIYVLFTVLISFVIFSVEDLSQIGTFVGGLFGRGNTVPVNSSTLYVLDSFAVLLVLCIVASLPLPKLLYEKTAQTKVGQLVYTFLEPVTLAVVLIVCTAFLVDGSFNPFLYFRF